MPAGSRIDTQNVSLGLGDLEIGEYVNNAFVSYRDAGIIRAALTATWTREIVTMEHGRPLLVVKQEVIREGFSVTFTLAEITVQNLKMALGSGVTTSGLAPVFMDGGATAPAGDATSSTRVVGAANTHIFHFGNDCGLNPAAIRFTHMKDCVAGLRQILEVFKAVPAGTLALGFNEADWNTYEVTFNALADTTKARGRQYMQLIDER